MRRNRMPKMLAIGMRHNARDGGHGHCGCFADLAASVVGEDPANYTPRVTTGVAVYKMLQVGPTMFAGGDFTQIQNSARTTTYNRNNLFSFNATTGAVSSFVRDLRPAPVWAMATDGTSLWVGGNFRTVNGVARRGLVKLNPTTGAVDTTFNAQSQRQCRRRAAGQRATDRRRQVHQEAAGREPGDRGRHRLPEPEHHRDGRRRTPVQTDIYRFAVNPARDPARRDRQLHAPSAARPGYRAFMVDLGATSGTLSTWYYTPLADAMPRARACQRSCATWTSHPTAASS